MEILRFKSLFLMISVGAILSSATAVRADDHKLRLSEQKIKAGLIYNFLKSTEWPSQAMPEEGSPLHVCLYGGDSFDGYLHPLQGRTARSHVINIRTVQSRQQANECHFVFINNNQQAYIETVLEIFKNTSALTASSIPSFARRGGMLEFGMKDQRVHIYMNTEEVARSGLIISKNITRLTEPVP